MATCLARLPVSSEGARIEVRQDTQEPACEGGPGRRAEADEQSEPGLVDAPGDPRRESTGSRSLRLHEDGPPTGRPRLFYAVASAAAHPAGAIGDGPGQHDLRHWVFGMVHRFCQLIPLALCSRPSETVWCCLNARSSGRSPPRDQGDHPRGAFHVKRTTQRERFPVALPRFSSFAARPAAPRLWDPGYPAGRIGMRGDFTGFNLYIDITLYLLIGENTPLAGPLTHRRAHLAKIEHRADPESAPSARPYEALLQRKAREPQALFRRSCPTRLPPRDRPTPPSTRSLNPLGSTSADHLFLGVHGCGRVSRGTPGENRRS